MKCKYTVSVVIPNYNNAKYLPKCVESIINQTYEISEIIIIDDCSIDNSVQVIKELEKMYNVVRGVFLTKNGGVSNARNKGLEMAKGNYITFIDADDYYYNKEKINNEMLIIRKYQEKYGEDILAYSKIIMVSNDLKEIRMPTSKRNDYLNGKIAIKLLVGYKFKTIMRDYCIKTDILKKIGGYNGDKSLYEDWELLIKIANEYKIFCTYEIGTAYRNSICGLSKRSSSELKHAMEQIFEEQIARYNILVKFLIRFLRLIVKIKSI